MKKVLFCTALLAIAAGCAENELDSLSIAEQGKGISFVAEIPETRMQWDETETSYVPFWYAEQDRIGIFATNVKKGQFGAATDVRGTNADKWSGLPTSESAADVTYKATQSQRTGAFTAISDDNLLHFKEGNAHFLAVYPSNVKAKYENGKVVLSNLPALAAQKQTTVKGYNESIFMYSMSTSSKENAYDAVGENVNLQFVRPLSALVFSTENANDYTKGGSNSIFGNLKTIKVTAKGWTPTSAGSPIAASTLTYDDTKATVAVDTVTYAATFNAGATPSEGSEVILTLNDGNGLAWDDEALAVVAIKNVDRSQTFSEDKKETMEVIFTFDKIELAMTNATNKSWKGFVEYPALDINKFPYLVTKGGGNTRTLIVNSGNFNDIFSNDGKIKWTETSGSGTVELSEIQTIISNVALTNTELAKIKNFTNVKYLTLKKNTSIPANTFDGMGAQLKEINLPAVTEIDKDFIDTDFSVLEKLNLASYQFENESVNERFFNATTAGKLTTLNISGVESMMPTFGIDRALSFKGYTALTEVTVQDGIIVAPNGFNGCTSLKTINGKLNLTNAVSAFDMESSTNSVLETVNVTGTTIPEKAFKKCTGLKNILYNGAQIAPTSVGASAFEGATSLKYMDLANATTIGASAFSGCTSYAGKAEGVNVLAVGVSTVEASIFASTKVYMVHFTDATVINPGIFTNADDLRQVKFSKKFSFAKTWTSGGTDTFGTSTNVDLFLNPDQASIMSGTTMTLPGTGNTITFKTVQYE